MLSRERMWMFASVALCLLRVAFSLNIPDYELSALQDLYIATNGPSWHWNPMQSGISWNFTGHPNPCADNWQGVTCSNTPITIDNTDYLSVTYLQLGGHEMYGQLPDSIGKFPGLIELNLARNDLIGTIPATIGNLTSLVYLNISENHFSGTIPDSVGRLTNLEQLDLATIVLNYEVLKKVITEDPEHQGSGLSGTLPHSLANLHNLRYFSVGFNELHGSPAVLGQLVNLEYLFLYLNQFTGPLSPAFDAFRHLRKFSCGSNAFTGDPFRILRNNVNLTQFIIGINNFTGTIPSNLGDRSDMIYLDMSYNNFTGSLPRSLEKLTYLALLNIAHSHLTGTIPLSLCDRTGMLYLDMALNHFTSTLPECFADLTYLQFFDMSANLLHGTIPHRLGELRHMQHFNLARNRFKGTIPASLGSFQHAYMFDLSGNELTGSMPEALGGLVGTQFFNLSSNMLTGTVPDSLGNLTALATLDLSYNKLRGSIPKSIGNLSRLEFLYLQDNQLSGSLPATLSRLARLQSLLVHRNSLTGRLTHIFDAARQVNLSTIQVSNNQLTGQFPEQIFALPRLQTVVAVVNCFFGSIPRTACDAKGLVTLALDGLQSATACRDAIFPRLSSAYLTRNQLEGGIPSCLYELPVLRALHLAGNGLTGSLSEDVTLSPTLMSLSLANNVLRGSIPEAIQRKSWYLLDLSFNRLSGVLSSDFAFGAANSSLSLQTNRLSGELPEAIIHAADVNVLHGSLFTCDVDKRDLPDQDPGKDHFTCGSLTFDAPYYLWVGLAALVLVVAYMLWRRRNSALFCGFNVEATAALLRRYYDCPIVLGSQREDSTLSTGSLETVSMGSARPSTVMTDLARRLQSCRFICELMDLNCKNAICIGGFNCLVLLIYFPIASLFYATHTHVYAYRASAAYVSGIVPFVMEYVLFVAFLLFVLVLYRVSIFLYERNARTRDRSSEVASAARIVYFSHRTARKMPVYIAYFVVNFTVVVGVNAGFVAISLHESNTVVIISQMALSMFKLLWNNVLSVYAFVFFADTDAAPGIEGTGGGGGKGGSIAGGSTEGGAGSRPTTTATSEQTSVSRVFYMQLFVTLMNNIAVPCLVVAAISPSCFYNVFIPAPAVESRYQTTQCVGVVLDTGCDLYTSSTETISYHPPFSYSYQCSSSFIKNYAPAFVYMCLTATFVVPLLQATLIRLHRRSKPGSRRWYVLGAMNQYPVPEHIVMEGAPPPVKPRWRKYFNANQILLNQLNYLGILMTFGVVFPPLAVALAFTVCAITLVARLNLGYFLSKCVELNLLNYVDTINSECTRVVSLQMLRNSVWMLITFACAFYTLFLFDALGDAVGLRRAYWVLIVMPLLPVCMYGGYRLFLLYTERISGDALEAQITKSPIFEIVLSPLSRATAVNDADLRRESVDSTA